MRRLVLLVGSLALIACDPKHGDPPAAGSGGSGDPEAGGGGGSGHPEAGGGGRDTAAGHGGVGGGAGTASAGTGGASMGAGTGGRINAGAGGNVAPGACSGVFCEDFESGMLDSKVWTRTQLSNGNTATVEGEHAAHGKYAAQFHAKAGSRYSLIMHDGLPDSLQKHYFGRIYYSASGFPNESGGHTAYITSSNSFTGFPDMDHHLEVSSYNDQSPIWQLGYWSGDGPEYIGSGGRIPVGKWFCLEWEFNDSPDEIAVWVDGDAKQGDAFRDIGDHASNLVGKLSAIALGFRTWHPMGAPDIDIYVDDVVLDTKRVGCLE